MAIEPITAERTNQLVCAKYIFLNAVDEFMKEGPFSSGIATSGFQDSVEMVLRAIAEHHHVHIKQHETFSALISKIAEITGLKVSHSSCLNQLNQARISFKHFGLSPQESDVSKFRSDLEGFFPQATSTFFGIDYDSISLVSLIRHRRTENYINEAEAHYVEGALEDVLIACAKAFELYKSYTKRNSETFSLDLPYQPDMSSDSQLAFEQLAKKIEAQDRALDLLRHQISLTDYVRFRNATPLVQLSMADTFFVSWSKTPDTSMETSRFCIKFVTDAIFKMKRSDTPNQWRIKPPERKFVVIRDCPIIVWPFTKEDDREEEIIRIATAGESLKGFYKNHDKDGYLSIIQDGQRAFIQLSNVKTDNR